MQKNGADKIELTGPLTSTEKEVVARCIAAMELAQKRRGWWASAQGRAALGYLQIWGATIRIRSDSGDRTVYPKMLGHGGSWQGMPDGMPGVAMIYESVNRWFATLGHRTPGLMTPPQQLLYWVHVNATDDQALVVRYQFADGSLGDPQPATDPEPVAFESVETLAEAFVQTAPLSKLPKSTTLQMESALLEWGAAGPAWWRDERGTFLEAMHLALARQMAGELGL